MLVKFKLPHTGFTMIEMMIVMMIMIIFFGLGYANFRDFQRRQTLESVARMIRTDLTQAREYAFSGVKPAGCDVLQHYVFSRTLATQYQIRGNCANSSTPIKTVNLASGITITMNNSMPNPLRFMPISNGTNVPTTCTGTCAIRLTQTSSGNIIDINVTSTGIIN
jgi:prepilin-type N-terminal cleavage/methylation domain-containing protein